MIASVYLDHAATTRVRPEVREAMEPYLDSSYGNPSSIYRLAQSARSALDMARDSVALCLGASPDEIIFTSGGTESDNAAIAGVAFARRERGRHIVTTAIEHHAVLNTVEALARVHGFEVTHIPVEASGVVDPGRVERAIRPDTVLLSVMWANNEIGTLQPVTEIAEISRARGIPYHVDAVQAAGMVEIDLSVVPVDLLSLSGHKFYGPKGTGVLYLRRGTPWQPLLFGGGQERERRAGTENVAGIVGLARALELACQEREETNHRVGSLREVLLRELEVLIPGLRVNGDRKRRLPNNVNIAIPGVQGESLLAGFDLAGIMVSSGSACATGSLEPSHVLLAIGLSPEVAGSSLRLTLGRENTLEEMQYVAGVAEQLVSHQRSVALAGTRA